MGKYYEEWYGKKFPVRVVKLPEELGGFVANVADYELWAAIEDDCEEDNAFAISIDNSIYFYCDSGYIASDPTDEEIVEYLREQNK